MRLNRFGGNRMGPQCVIYALIMRPLCARYVSTMSLHRFGVKSLGPQWAHYAPTMRPLCAHYVFKPFKCLTAAPKMCPRCAHYAPTMCLNRFAVKVMGPTCEYYETVLG
jgi:hypothetical protein